MANVLAFAEARGGELRKVAFEAVTAARKLADASGGGEVHVLLAGGPGIGGKAEQLGKYGADVVYVAESADFATFARESLAATLADRAKAGSYRAVVLGFSAQGRDLGPRVAARLDAPIASDVTDFTVSGDSITVKHPAYANKVIMSLTITGSPVVLSIRPSAFTAAEAPKTPRVETVQATSVSGPTVTVIEVKEGAKGRPDLGEAPIIISGGRGLKAKENFKLVEDLADAFGNAAVGATRAVTDDGWRPHSDQIGQTGRTVSPQLYVAVGISGAIQHLAGMKDSKVIAAINKDEEAPIFGVADYGVVADLFAAVPEMVKEIG